MYEYGYEVIRLDMGYACNDHCLLLGVFSSFSFALLSPPVSLKINIILILLLVAIRGSFLHLFRWSTSEVMFHLLS